MRAAVLRAPGELTVQTVERPAPGPGEVLVRIMATAVCGTDIGVYRGQYREVSYPIVPGHESAGQVEAVGPGVSGLEPGDRIVVNPLTFCGRCRFCLRGDTSLCPEGGLVGRDRPGTFAQFAVIKALQGHLLPETIDWADATSLVVLSSVIRGQRRAGLARGHSVGVIGLGASGLLHTQLAKRSGAGPVIGISRSQWKLDLALRLGADAVVEAGPDAAGAVRRAAGGGLDFVLDTVASGKTLDLAFALAGPGATILAFGVDPSPATSLSSLRLYSGEYSLLGVRAMTPHDVDLAVRAVKQGLVDVRFLVTHRYPLEDLPAVMETRTRSGEGLRAVFYPWDAPEGLDREVGGLG